jgi:hypothetical protein
VQNLRKQLRSHTAGAKFELRAPDRVLVDRWIRSAWNDLSAATIANGYKKSYGCLLDEADVAAVDLIDALAQHCAIDVKVGEVESEDDIEEVEEAVAKTK